MTKAEDTLMSYTVIDEDAHFAMEQHAIEFAEYLIDNHKYCEPDGWKDINGKGETLTIDEIYKQFNNGK